MTLFMTSLWKEWRDQRVAIVGFALVVPIVLGVAYGFAPGWWASQAAVPSFAALAGFAIAAIAFGADLVPGELRRGRLPFLARLPLDLRGAFAAKVAFFLAALASFTAWTYLNATAASALLRHGPWLPPFDWSGVGSLLPLLLIATSWLFAVSCWLQRGTLVLPGTAITLALFGAPVVLAFLLHPGMTPPVDEWLAAIGWLTVAGFGVAALSFLKGLRHGGPWRARLLWSIGPALAAFAPLYGWTGMRVAEFRRLDPSLESFRIAPVTVGRDGRYAFVNASHWHDSNDDAWLSRGGNRLSATHAMVIDLATGESHEAGEPSQHFRPLAPQFDGEPSPFVVLAADRLEFFPRYGQRISDNASDFLDVFDVTSGRPISREQWKQLLLNGGALDQNLWAINTVVVADAEHPSGQRFWVRDRKIFHDDGAGVVEELPTDGQSRWYCSRGHGFQGDSVLYDCTRRRAFRSDKIRQFVHFIRGGDWIIVSPIAGKQYGEFKRLDPESGAIRPIAGLEQRESVESLLCDGRLLVSGGAESGLALLDPERGERIDLVLPDQLGTDPNSRRITSAAGETVMPDGALMLSVWNHTIGERDSIPRLVRIDVRRNEVAVAGPFESASYGVLGIVDRDTVIVVEDSRRIVRAHFDGRPNETLFPKTP